MVMTMTTKTTKTGSHGQEAIRDLEEVIAELQPKTMLYIVGDPNANAYLDQYRMAHKAMSLAEKAGIALELDTTIYPSDSLYAGGRNGNEWMKTNKRREDGLKRRIVSGAYDLVVIAESCMCCVGYDDRGYTSGSIDANVIRYMAKAKPRAAYIMIPSGENEETNAHEAAREHREYMRSMLVK